MSACPSPKPSEPPDAGLVGLDATAAAKPSGKAAVPPIREATQADLERALVNLEAWVKPGASDPKNPWALAHGVTAFGREHQTSDNRAAIDVMVGDYLETLKKGSRVRWAFPLMTAEHLPAEPHRDLFIKTLIESGVPFDRKFRIKGGTVTLAALAQDAEQRFTIPNDDAGWRNFAWSAYAMMLANRSENRLQTDAGVITFAELAEKIIGRLEVEQAFLEPLLGHPERLEKKRQGIFAHHCGGLHFVQAAVLGASLVKDPALIARVRHQLDLVLFRWDAERRIYKETLWNEPKYRWLLLVQELKFYGHILETFGLARDYGLLAPDEALSKRLRQTAADLVETISMLQPAYERQAVIGELAPQTQYDLIGDGCHAIRGLKRGLVAFFAP